MNDHNHDVNFHALNATTTWQQPFVTPSLTLSHQLVTVSQSPQIIPATTYLVPLSVPPLNSMPTVSHCILPALVFVSTLSAPEIQPLQSGFNNMVAPNKPLPVLAARGTDIKKPDLPGLHSQMLKPQHQPLSTFAQQIQKQLDKTPQDRQRPRLMRAMMLKKQHPELTLGELVKLTEKPSAPPCQLSDAGKMLCQLMPDELQKLLLITRPLHRIMHLQSLAKRHSLLLNRSDITHLAQASAAVVGRYPKLINKPLSKFGLHIKEIIDSNTPGDFARKKNQSDYQWAMQLFNLQPQLTVTDLVLFTGGSFHSLALMTRAMKKPLTAAGAALQNWLKAPEWNPYKQLSDESNLDWVARVSNMDSRLKDFDLVRLKDSNAYSIRYRIDQRNKLSDKGNRIRQLINSPGAGEYAFRPGEEWTEWFSRLKRDTELDEHDLCCITGLTPVIRRRYFAEKSLASPVSIATTLPTPLAAPSDASFISASSARHHFAVGRLNEQRYAFSQSVSLNDVDCLLQAKGFIRVPNNANTGTPDNNCLLISLLQHATGDYSQKPELCKMANDYRQLLVALGWRNQPRGFNKDGFIAFSHNGEASKGCAAALIEMININLIKEQLPPLQVVNYSFAAGMECEEVQGSSAANARRVHIVNIGQHFEALVACRQGEEKAD